MDPIDLVTRVTAAAQGPASREAAAPAPAVKKTKKPKAGAIKGKKVVQLKRSKTPKSTDKKKKKRAKPAKGRGEVAALYKLVLLLADQK